MSQPTDHIRRALGIGIVAAAALTGPTAAASDLDKERRWSEQIVDFLIDGEAVWLDDGASEFLALFTEAADAGSRRGALVLHGSGVHPDWDQVVKPLRVGLTEHGWHTLSLQMPILVNEAPTEDYAMLLDEVGPRLEAGIAYLRAREIEEIVLVAHSMGSTMAASFLAGQAEPAVRAFVAIGMSADRTPIELDGAHYLGSLSIATLDLYGEDDLESVVDSAEARARAGGVNPGYTQRVVAGADHFFAGMDDVLVDAVQSWLAVSVGAAR